MTGPIMRGIPESQCAPLPLAGRGRGWGSCGCVEASRQTPTPTPPASLRSAVDPPRKGEGKTEDAARPSSIRLHARLHGILDVLDFVELDIDERAVHLLDAADVDVLDDVARLRIDRDRAARALPRHALGGGDQ